MTDTSISQPQNGNVATRAYHRRAVAPPVDVFENSDELLIVADVPGVRNGDVDLRVENGVLALEARRAQTPEGESPALVREVQEADFAATYRIPAGIDATAIAAEAKNGTLVVHLPKAAAVKARKIVVR
jgi:HSP20 family molecular chaperone IbpA